MRIAFSSKHVVALALLVGACSSNAVPAPTESSGAVEAQSKALLQLAQDSNTPWKWTVHANNGTVAHLAGRSASILKNGITGEAATLTFLGQYKDLYKMVEPSRELRLLREEKDAFANTHVRMQQFSGGIPVRGGELIAHFDRTGALTSIDTHYAVGLDALDKNPALRADQADAAATSDLTGELKELTSAALVRAAAPALKIFVADSGAGKLAYHVRLRGDTSTRPVLMDYMIDAQTGAVLQKYDDIETLTGTGVGTLGDTKTLQISQGNNGYQLVDTSRTAAGITTNSLNGAQGGTGSVVTSDTTSSWDTGGAAAGAAVDAHFAAGIVYDYYKTVHGRAGIDGADSAIISNVHYGQGYDNAFWDGTQMNYGDGDGTQFRSFTASADVIAHELTHGVTQSTSNMQYLNQSGALNEAVSDIFGCLVAHAIKPDDVANFKLGTALSLANTPFRDMIHPAAGHQPASLSQYVNTTTDNGGVHTNSGVVNNAMYLMTIGGTNDGTQIAVSAGMGWDKSEKLWYQANTKYFMTTTDFAGAAQATMSAAKDLQFSQNDQNIVECSWIATGVLSGACKPLVVDSPTGGGIDAGAGVPSSGGSGGTGAGNGTGDGRGTGTGDGSGTPSDGTTPPAAGDTPGGTATGTPTAPGSTSTRRFQDAAPPTSGCSAAPNSGPGNTGVLGLLVAGAMITIRRRVKSKR